jgi:hypothetical protein
MHCEFKLLTQSKVERQNLILKKRKEKKRKEKDKIG